MKKLLRDIRLHVPNIEKYAALTAVFAVLLGVTVSISSFLRVDMATAHLDAVGAVDQLFSQDAEPTFTLDTDGLVPAVGQQTAYGELLIDSSKIKVEVLQGGEVLGISPKITALPKGQNGEFEIKVPRSAQFLPGKYRLKVSVETPSKSELLEFDFFWGTMAINVDKSSYQQGDQVTIDMSVLSDNGTIICDANLTLEIKTPLAETFTLRTADKDIVVAKQCADSRGSDQPDYRSVFKPTADGTYTLDLTAETSSGVRHLTSTFEVRGSSPYVIERQAAMRAYPTADYTMRVLVTALEDMSGSITERVPTSFEVKQIGSDGSITDATNGTQTIAWPVTLKAGKQVVLEYRYTMPYISPQFYLLGPLEIWTLGNPGSGARSDTGLFREPRSWQIISSSSELTDSGEVGGKRLSESFFKGIPQVATLDKPAPLPEDAPNRTRAMKGYLENQKASEPAKVQLAKASVPNNARYEVIAPNGDTLTEGITAQSNGDSVEVTVQPQARSGRAGKYTVQAIDPVTGEVASSSDYTWGVLAFNPDYAVYPENTPAKFAFGVLDDAGRVVCDAALVVKVTDPAGSVTVLATGNATIRVNPDCFMMEGTQLPDYEADYQPKLTGTYSVDIFASTRGGERTWHDTFSVDPNARFYLKRSGPTRTYYPSTYDYSFDLKAVEAGTYQVTEKVPSSFLITGDGFELVEQGDTKLIRWSVDVAAGETRTLRYSFKGPAISPYLFFFGEAEVLQPGGQSWTEPRRWMLASDNACTSNVTSGNWNTAGTWTSCGGLVPQAADTVTILDGHTVTLDTSPSVVSVTINGGSTGGTLTNDGVARTLTITATSGTLFTLTSPGTFNPGTSITVTMNPNASVTTTSGAITFYNLNLTPAISASGKTYTMGSGALTINGSFNIAPTSSAQLLTVNMGADITVASTGTTTIGGTTATSKIDLRPASTDYNLSTGFINITTQGTLDGASASSTITLTGTGTGTLITRAGTFTQGTTEVIVTSASGSPRLLSAATTFHRLTINAAATVVNAGAVITMSSTDANNRLYIQSGVFNDGGNTIVGTANGTFVMDGGAVFCVSGTALGTNATCDSGATPTTASTFPTNYTNGNITFSSTSTVYYNANAAATISSTPTYGNLILRPLLSAARAYTIAAGNMTVTGDFTSQPASSSATTRALTTTLGGTTSITGLVDLQSRTATGLGTSTLNTSAASSHTLTMGRLVIGTSCTFTMNNSFVELNGTSGTLLSRTGTFTAAGASSLLAFTSDASVTLTDNSTYSFSSVGFSPRLTADRTYTLGSGAITYNAAAAFSLTPIASDVPDNTTATLTVNLGANTTINAAQTVLIAGGTSTGGKVARSVLDTTASNRTLSTGFISIGAQGELKANASTVTLTGTTAAATLFDLSTGGVFTAGTSTVSVTGVTNSNVINSANFTGSNALYNLTINATGVTKSLGGDLEVTNLTTVTLGTLDLDVTNNYTLTTGRISLANSASAIINARAGTIYLTGTTTPLITKGASGVFTQGTSEVIVTGAATVSLISAAVTFHRLTIDNASANITAGAVITMSNANASNRLYIKNGILDCAANSIVGTANGTLVIDAGGTLELGSAAGAATFPTNYTNGNITLDVASTVLYQAGVAQNVSGVPTYGNLTITPLSGTPVYTIQSAGPTIAGNFSMTAGSLVDNGQQITGTAGKSFTMSGSSNLCLGGTSCTASSTTATEFPLNYTNSDITLGASTTVTYLANANQTVSSTPTYNNLSIVPVQATTAKTYTIASGTLTVNGNMSIVPITGAFQLTVNMGGDLAMQTSGTLTIGGTTSTSKLVTRPASTDYNISVGKISISTTGTLDCTGAASVITLTGTTSTLFTKAGTFTAGSSEVVVASASGTPSFLSVATSFYKLTIDSTATVINDAFGVTISNSAGAEFYVKNGVFNATVAMTGPGAGNGTLRIDAGATLCLGGTTASTNSTCDSGATIAASRAMPTFQTYTFDPASTVRYLSNAAQTVSSTPVYGNLVLAPLMTVARTYTLGTGALTVEGDFTILPNAGSALALLVNPAGAISVNNNNTTTISSTGSASATLDLRPSATDYNLTTGDLVINTGDTLDGTGSSAVITLTGTSGTLFDQGGTYTIGTTTVTVTSASGTPTLLSADTTFHRLTINAATAISAGAVITMSNASAANRLYVQAGTLDDAGFQIAGTANGTLQVDAGATLRIGDGTATTFPTNYTTGNTTLNATSTVVYDATSAQTISATPASYGHLQLSSPSGTPTKTLGGALTINGNLTIDASNTLDTDSVNDYDITLKGNFTNSGTFSAQQATVLLSGTSTQTMSGTMTGGSAFYDLSITNSSGTNASDCERTGFVASVDFDASAEVTNTYTITTASVRVEYESGSTYTFTNINWNGQATGTRIFFRNSAASGTWLLVVSGTQTATTYMNVSRSDASGGDLVGPVTYSVNCANNTNWEINTPPDTASAHAQKRVTAGTTIATGGWANETQVQFTATVTDPDNPDTISLCVEVDILGVAFSNTEDACGTGASYSGSGVTATVTLSGLADGQEYHWQARTKDSFNAYSSWVQYGGNAESARDFGVDATAPTGGTVNDGTGADQDENDGSLTAIAANWSGFDAGVSGLSKYEYAVRRSSDNWYYNNGTTTWQSSESYVDNTTNTSFDIVGQNLTTGELYYVTVRVTDNATNQATVNSDGQTVLPTLSFSYGSAPTFAPLNPSNSYTDTESISLTTSTNASTGYVIQAYLTDVFRSLETPSEFVSHYTGTWASPTTWGGGTYGFGYTSDDTLVQGSNRFSGGTKYAGFGTTAPGDVVADHTDAVNGSTGAVVNEVFNHGLKVAVPSDQTAGTYRTNIVYIVTANY